MINILSYNAGYDFEVGSTIKAASGHMVRIVKIKITNTDTPDPITWVSYYYTREPVKKTWQEATMATALFDCAENYGTGANHPFQAADDIGYERNTIGNFQIMMCDDKESK